MKPEPVLVTAREVAADLKMSWQVVLRWHRAGKIKAEVMVGRAPRFVIRDVRRQLAADQAKRDAEKFKGMVPTL